MVRDRGASTLLDRCSPHLFGGERSGLSHANIHRSIIKSSKKAHICQFITDSTHLDSDLVGELPKLADSFAHQSNCLYAQRLQQLHVHMPRQLVELLPQLIGPFGQLAAAVKVRLDALSLALHLLAGQSSGQQNNL